MTITLNDYDAEALLDAMDVAVFHSNLSHIQRWANIMPDINGDIHKPRLSRDPTEEFLWILCVLLFGEYEIDPRDGYIPSDNKTAYRQFLNTITKKAQEFGKMERFND